MLELAKTSWQAKVLLIFFLLLSGLWGFIFFFGPADEGLYDFFTISYGLTALWGGIWGLTISQKWGGYKSLIGRSILMFSLGLLSQEIGQLAYTYFIYVQHIDVPYPSIGDIGFFGSVIFYILGTYYLAKSSGVRLRIGTFSHRLQAIAIPLLMLLLGYTLFLSKYSFEESSILVIILDFGYPLGQAIYISLAILTYLLSRNILGGIMKNVIFFILIALVVQFLSDYVFLYQVSREIWTISGINDYMFLISYTIMSLGLFRFNTVYNKLRKNH